MKIFFLLLVLLLPLTSHALGGVDVGNGKVIEGRIKLPDFKSEDELVDFAQHLVKDQRERHYRIMTMIINGVCDQNVKFRNIKIDTFYKKGSGNYFDEKFFTGLLKLELKNCEFPELIQNDDLHPGFPFIEEKR